MHVSVSTFVNGDGNLILGPEIAFPRLGRLFLLPTGITPNPFLASTC